jgi:hypothetical protein
MAKAKTRNPNSEGSPKCASSPVSSEGNGRKMVGEKWMDRHPNLVATPP